MIWVPDLVDDGVLVVKWCMFNVTCITCLKNKKQFDVIVHDRYSVDDLYDRLIVYVHFQKLFF